MSYQAVQIRRFARQYKKPHDNVAADVDAAVITAGTQHPKRRIWCSSPISGHAQLPL